LGAKHTHSNESKQLIRDKKIGTKLSEATKKKIIVAKGHAVYLYKINTNISTTPLSLDFILIEKFNSIRELGRFLKVSQSTISRYLKSGKIFKNCYKISSTPIL
jgi:transcriptional antiterminator